MEVTVHIGPRMLARVMRTDLSDVVTISIGEWPHFSNIYLNQNTARQLGIALIAAGFDYSRDPAATPEGLKP